MKDYNNLTKEIIEKQYVSVPIDISQKELYKAAEIFLEFLQQEEEEKEKFKVYVPYKNEKGEIVKFGRGDVTNEGSRLRGFKRKEKKEGEKDNKQYFHYSPDADKKFDKILENSSEITKEFIENTRKIYLIAQKKIKEILKEIDKDYPGSYNQIFNEKNEMFGTLRFLSYYTSKEGDFIAKRHYDKGFATLALAESHPGLELGTNDEDIKEVEHKKDEAIFFPSYLLSKFTKGEIKPTWHGVTQKRRFNEENISSRWAIVFFCEPLYLEEEVLWEEIHKVKK